MATLAVLVFRSGPALPDQSAYRFTPFSFEPGGRTSPVWSPDGKAVAYATRADQTAPYQVYLRYLELPTPLQLTHMKDNAYPMRWSADGTYPALKADGRADSVAIGSLELAIGVDVMTSVRDRDEDRDSLLPPTNDRNTLLILYRWKRAIAAR